MFRLTAVGAVREPDRDAIRSALAVLTDPAHGVELRALPSARSYVLAARDLDQCTAMAAVLADENVYYTLNPIPPHLNHSARVGDVLKRRWILVDVDPVKAEGHKDNSATDAEKGAATQTAQRIKNHLTDQGWPDPVEIDSGNGWHLLYRVDLPSDEHVRVLIGTLLRKLASEFDSDGAKVDRSVHNASRIAKLPGTWARKGKSTPERPHRMCRIVSCPEEPEVVSVELIRLAAGIEEAKPPEPAAPSSPFKLSTENGTVGSYARAALQGELDRIASATPGTEDGRNVALNRAAFSLGQLVGGGELDRNSVEQALTEEANRVGLDTDPGCGPRGIAATIRSGIEAGILKPRKVPEKKGKKDPDPVFAAGIVPNGELIIYRASTVTPRVVEWLWPVRIPLGKLTTFAGIGGLGKTFVLCDITARVTKGMDWPDCPGEVQPVGQVLFVSGEDDPDDTLVPRLIEARADLNKVAFLKTEVQDRFTLADTKTLELALEQMGAAVRLVVIDPPTAYLGGIDDHKNSELRGLLSPLKSLAAKHRVAVVFNTHINKGSGQKVEAMQRVMGSVAWVNAVRAAHLFARDPEDPTRRFFVGMKMNLAKERKGLAYRILTTETLARIEWLGEVDTTADEAVNRERKQPRKMLAKEWLVDLFSQKLEWPSDQFWESARHHGISKNAIDEARVKLCMPKARKETHPNGETAWTWWVPPDWPPLAEAKQQQTEAIRPPAEDGSDETAF